MIVITGANGHYGRTVVDGLLQKLPASAIGVSVRDPEKSAELAAKGVRVTKGDFADPSSLRPAFDGAEQVLIVSANVLGDEALRLHRNAIDGAKQAGVKRILYTSHQAASSTSKVAFARDHAATEELLQSCGVPFVSLRNGFYTESAFYQLGGMQETGRLALPQDGPVSWTARNDLADAAVTALTDPGLFDGISAPLTASETHTFEDFARIASQALGTEVVRDVIPDDEYRTNALKRGFPEPVVGMLLSMFEAIRDGEFSVVDPKLATVLGRQPAGVSSILTAYLSERRPNAG